MWANYHCHSIFCDGKNSIHDIVTMARQLGMHSIGVSSHAPLPFPSSWCMKSDQLNAYLQVIERDKSKPGSTEVYAGMEIDFIPGKISPRDFKHQLDYTIGSVHFVDYFSDGRGWEIDGPHNFFLQGLEAIFKNDIQQVVERYFELTREMVATGQPDVIGHMDKIKIQNIQEKFFRESDTWYQQAIDQTLTTIARYGGIVEVNTRGLYQQKTTTTYPSPWVLEKILAKKIPITLSSDAHHRDDLTNCFPDVTKQLIQFGFKEIHILSQGKWTPTRFNEHGILN
ncbi:MAG: histidinol-phosphatase [Cyclobacteriaceae bacterium]|nr:histidinol-phosphatase [Cyclobacteriaceae bacterium]